MITPTSNSAERTHMGRSYTATMLLFACSASLLAALALSCASSVDPGPGGRRLTEAARRLTADLPPAAGCPILTAMHRRLGKDTASSGCPNCICTLSTFPRKTCLLPHFWSSGKCEVEPCSDCEKKAEEKERERVSAERREAEKRDKELVEKTLRDAAMKRGWHIESAHSGLALNMHRDAPDAGVTQEFYRNIPDQIWDVKWTEDGFCEIQNKETEKYLCAEKNDHGCISGREKDRSKVCTRKRSDGTITAHQRQWTLTRVSFVGYSGGEHMKPVTTDDDLREGQQPDSGEGDYYIIRNRASKLVLDIEGGTKESGANLITYKFSQEKIFQSHKRNQVFQFKHM